MGEIRNKQMPKKQAGTHACVCVHVSIELRSALLQFLLFVVALPSYSLSWDAIGAFVFAA
jgi:hypothetical protein